jgi:hypothetical protein
MVAECHRIEHTLAGLYTAWFRVKEILEIVVQREKSIQCRENKLPRRSHDEIGFGLNYDTVRLATRRIRCAQPFNPRTPAPLGRDLRLRACIIPNSREAHDGN